MRMNTDTLAACAAILLLALPVYAPVAGAQSQAYKVIVLADTRALHKETLDKIKEFRKTRAGLIGPVFLKNYEKY